MKTLPIDEKGATLIEFALILPVLLLLLIGIIEFGLIIYDKTMLTNACREGLRAGVVYSWPNYKDTSFIDDFVNKYGEDHLISFGESEFDINYDPLSFDPPLVDDDGLNYITPPCEQGKYIAVKIKYDYKFLFLPIGNISLNSQASMRCE